MQSTHVYLTILGRRFISYNFSCSILGIICLCIAIWHKFYVAIRENCGYIWFSSICKHILFSSKLILSSPIMCFLIDRSPPKFRILLIDHVREYNWMFRSLRMMDSIQEVLERKNVTRHFRVYWFKSPKLNLCQFHNNTWDAYTKAKLLMSLATNIIETMQFRCKCFSKPLFELTGLICWELAWYHSSLITWKHHSNKCLQTLNLHRTII